MRFFFEKKDKENKDLIEQIILEKYNQYYRLAYSYVHNDADACDIVQSGAYNAIKNSHTLKQPAFAETWIYRIMLNECFKFLKQPKLFSYESIQEENGPKVCYTEDNYHDFELREALNILSDKDRAVVILKYFEDKKLDEIAYILDENINTIKSRLYRCLKKLRGFLYEDADNSKQNLIDEVR